MLDTIYIAPAATFQDEMSEDEEEVQRMKEEERQLAEGSESDRIRLKYLRHRREQEREAMYVHLCLFSTTRTDRRSPEAHASCPPLVLQAKGEPHQALPQAKAVPLYWRHLKGACCTRFASFLQPRYTPSLCPRHSPATM